MECTARLRGATVARLTPDQKAACSNHVGVNLIFVFLAAFKLPINLISKCPGPALLASADRLLASSQFP
jgi:hypothetical protein